MTRRGFLGACAAAGVARAEAKQTARPFPLDAVRLLPGPMLDAAEANRSYLHRLEVDRLVHTFRLNAGLASAAAPLGGWESPSVEIRGHFTGHFLSACALSAKASGDRVLKAKGDAIVAELAACQKKLGGGYVSAFPTDFFDRVKNGKPVWVPWYTAHKILAGLVDMHQMTGNKQALEVAEGMAQWSVRWLRDITDEHMARIMRVEFGGMNDVLVELARITGNSDYAAASRRFEDRRIIDPLAEGVDKLKGLHANTQIPKITGIANAYDLTGEARYRRIAEFFWDQVTGKRCYCTGGTSDHEHWRTEAGNLATELSEQTHECCCTYNLLKLTRRLFAWNAVARYADYMERALWNGILGTINPADGMTMYFVPMASGYWRVFGRPFNSFWCCTGSGTESFAKLADSIYFHDDAGVWVNLFAASELRWAAKGALIRQQTSFPNQAATSLTVTVDRPVRFAMRLRVPWWCKAGYRVRVNGKVVKGAATPSSYFTLLRNWKTGDRVDVEMPMNVAAEALPGDANTKAFTYGPLVLAGDLGAAGLTDEMHRGDAVQLVKNHFLLGKPTAVAAIGSGARPQRDDADALGFRMEKHTLVPFYRINQQRYALHWRTATAG